MRVIPAIHHLEILALRERLNTGLSHWQNRVQAQAPTLEEFIATHAVLREGVKSIRAGREWIVALLIGLLMGSRDEATQTVLLRAQNQRQPEPRASKSRHADVDIYGANHALRYSKSCVLWSRYLG